jgi:plastocyanin
VGRRPRGPIRRRIAIAALAAGLVALAIAPAGASAADPVPGCVQTNAPADPTTEISEWTCHSNPVTVGGYEVKRPSGYPQVPFTILPKPEVSGNITHMDVDVADGNGPIPIERLMLHHIVFFNTGVTDSVCGNAERFYGAGEERLKMSFPAGYGYPIEPDDTWATTYMYMNHRAQTDKGWIKYTFTVDPNPAIRSVKSYWMDVDQCAIDPIYNVPGIDLPEIPNCSKLNKAAKKKKTKPARRKAARCVKRAKALKATIPPSSTHTQSLDVTMEQNGWIVAGGGHVHGGAKELNLSKPNCPGSPVVARSTPTWGNPDHAFYRVKPVLHEPGPIGMSAFRAPDLTGPTTTGSPDLGIPVRNGQTVRVNSLYDELQPHTRVMGIYIVYVAPRNPPGVTTDPPVVGRDCEGLPAGTTSEPGTTLAGRTTPPPFTVPLVGLDQNFNAVEIEGPPGAFRTLGDGATITVGDRFFSDPNVRITPGTTLNYNFSSEYELHNVTLANGPLGIGSDDERRGVVYSQRFDRAGTYKLFCGLHPVQMTQRIEVQNPKKKKRKKKRKKRK